MIQLYLTRLLQIKPLITNYIQYAQLRIILERMEGTGPVSPGKRTKLRPNLIAIEILNILAENEVTSNMLTNLQLYMVVIEFFAFQCRPETIT